MHVNAHHSEPMEMETLKPGSTRKSSEGWSCSTKLDPLGPEQKPSTFNPSNSLMPKFPAIPSLAALSHARIKTFALGMSHNDRCSRMSQENWSFWGFWRAPFRSWFGYDNTMRKHPAIASTCSVYSRAIQVVMWSSCHVMQMRDVHDVRLLRMAPEATLQPLQGRRTSDGRHWQR